MSAAKPDPVSSLLTCAETLRRAARAIEQVELSDPEHRQDLRDLIGEIRRNAFLSVSLGALELRRSIASTNLDRATELPGIVLGRLRVNGRT